MFELGQHILTFLSLQQLSEVVKAYLMLSIFPPPLDDIAVVEWSWSAGRPRLNIESQTLLNLPGTGRSKSSMGFQSQLCIDGHESVTSLSEKLF